MSVPPPPHEPLGISAHCLPDTRLYWVPSWVSIPLRVTQQIFTHPSGSQNIHNTCARGQAEGGPPPQVPAPSGLCNEAASPGTVTCRPTEDHQPFQCPAKASRRCGLSGPLQASPMSGCWQFNQEAVGAPRTILGCGGHLTNMTSPSPFLCCGPESPSPCVRCQGVEESTNHQTDSEDGVPFKEGRKRQRPEPRAPVCLLGILQNRAELTGRKVSASGNTSRGAWPQPLRFLTRGLFTLAPAP